MPFHLKTTVPWGRNLKEYQMMFNLSETDMNKKIISFGDGPACFNFEMTALGKSVTSIDPIYQFTKDELSNRIDEVRVTIMKQLRENRDVFDWTLFKDDETLEKTRMESMGKFLDDLELGLDEKRYVSHELPNRLTFSDKSFELGLSSHFLLLYPQLGIEFHIASITEMLRVCKEVRIFPILNLNSERSEMVDPVIKHFKVKYDISIEKTSYHFQKGGNEMLVITSK